MIILNLGCIIPLLWLWILTRTKTEQPCHSTTSIPGNFIISSELTSIPDRLIFIWSATRDVVLRKCRLSSTYRYGLQFEVKNNNLHLLLYILLSGDVAINPGPCKNQHLRCLSFNAQSIRSKIKSPDGTFTSNLKSFQDLVYAERLDMIMVTETWLNNNITNNEILPKGYHVIRKDRHADKRGGGVLIALREDIAYNRINSRNNSPNWSDRIEIIALELNLLNSKKSLVCACYRPPSCDLEEWFELFTAFLQETSHYEKVFITGDFNFPDLSWNSNLVSTKSERCISVGSSKFRELTFDFFLNQVNMYPTRHNNILDLVLTTAPENVVNLSCVSAKTMDLSSDHSLTFFDVLLHIKSTGFDKRTVFDFHRADWNGLYHALNHSNLSPNESSDINDDWKRWKDLFLGVAAEFIPLKTFKRRSSPPWIDSEVRRLLSKKDSCRKKAKLSSCANLWEKFRELRRAAKKLVNTKRRQYFEKLPSLLKSNSKKFWSVFKSTSKHSNIPSKMTWTQQDSTSYTAENPVDIVNLLNRYFYSVFNHSETTDDHSVPVDPDNDTTTITTISDISLTEEEVCAVLKALDEVKATGPDKIPALLLKNCAVNISSSLCQLFNKSLSCGILPSEWKLANISPIPKQSPIYDVSNHRPISLLSLVSKVFERCIYNRLIEHVHGQIYELQYGFRRGKSTTSQLLHVLHQILNALEQRNQVDIVYLDFAKAFDKVNHDLLLVKLQNFGIRGNLLRWFKNFLSGRFQRVTALGVTSEQLPVLSGVPQGSILGPLLFIIYVNDLPKSVSPDTTTAMFADDTKCHRPIKNSEDNKTLQSDLDNITNWCHVWKMDLNQTKCGVLHLTRSREPTITEYTVLDTPVNRSSRQRDLGISITSDLKWNTQVQDISSKANKMLGFVKRTAYAICNQSVRKALYLTLVRSQLAYGSQVWAPQTVNNIQTVEHVQRRATKFILSLPYQTNISYKERLQILDLIPLCYWHEYLDIVYIFKSLKNDSDSNISVKVSTRETRSTSNGTFLNVGKCRTVNYQNSYYIRAAKVWNTLPSIIRDTTKSLTSFKTLLRKHYKDLTDSVFNPDDPRTLKSVCVKCHTSRPLWTLLSRSCC